MNSLNNILYKTLHTVRYVFWQVFKPNTQGVRVMVFYKSSVLLIEHSYGVDFYFPGGGVKKNETFQQAAVREMKEEVNVRVQEEKLTYFGTYQSKEEGKNDVVCVFVCKLEKEPVLEIDNKEITSAKFYELNSLPSKTSGATKRRLEEYKKKIYPLLGKW